MRFKFFHHTSFLPLENTLNTETIIHSQVRVRTVEIHWPENYSPLFVYGTPMIYYCNKQTKTHIQWALNIYTN